MDLFFILAVVFTAGVATIGLWQEKKTTTFLSSQIQKVVRDKVESEDKWAASYKAVNQKLNDAYARQLADKKYTELGMRRAASLEKAEAKRKAMRALKVKSKAV